jgi:methionyl-tRNA formyltransferase
MKLVYLGSPEMAVAPLRALHAAGHQILMVVSAPDRRRSRRGEPTPTPVKAAALELGLPVAEHPDAVRGLGADLGVVVAYGQLLRPPLLAELELVNLHFSLLPRWRGAAPVERSLLAGDRVTGVCLMRVDEGLDTGCVYDRVEVPIGPTTTAAELRDQLVVAGTDLLVGALGAGLGPCTPQPEDGVTYAAKLTPADLELDWRSDRATLDRLVRVGGAWTTFRGERFKVHELTRPEPGPTDPPVAGDPPPAGTVTVRNGAVVVRCGDAEVHLARVQPAGRPPMGAQDWANGASPDGAVLGDAS